MAAVKKRRCSLARSLEATLLIVIIVAVWFVMTLPVVIYFVPLNTGSSSTSAEFDEELINISVCYNGSRDTLSEEGNTPERGLVCQENFFVDEVSGVCKPSCSSWLMFSPSDTIVSHVIIGTSTVIGIVTTVVIVSLSLIRFRNMLVFPTVLVLYQDIIVSVHGVNILIGFINRRLFCTSEDLTVSYSSPASPYCTISGLLSSQVVLPLAIWITIQVGYIFLAVHAPFYFNRLKSDKRKECIVHIMSLLLGIISQLVPFFLIFGLGGFSLIDTLFPPVVCFARDRNIWAFVILIPLGILMAVIVTLLVLILHKFVRNRWISKVSKKDGVMKKAEIKVLVICICYVILGLGASLAYSISSAFLADLQRELMDYFECEHCGVNSGQMCHRSGFERLTNPPLITIGYSVFVLYPLVTLVYFIRPKGKSKQTSDLTRPDIASEGQ